MAPLETLTPTANTLWQLDVDVNSSAASPSWTQVRALNNLTPPVVNYTTQDSTDYDSAGWGSDANTLQKWQVTGTALRKYSPTSGAYDPGQEFLRTAGLSGALVHVRVYERRAGGEAYDGWALVQWAAQGGDPSGLNAAQITLLGQGPNAVITNPYTTTVLPTIGSATPSGAATGALVTIKGAGFTGATGVKFAAVSATVFTVLGDSTIVVVVPSGSAGAAAITVTTPAGTSSAFTYTRAA